MDSQLAFQQKSRRAVSWDATNNWEVGIIGSQEVVVEAREVGTATGQEAQAGVDLENSHVLAFDNVKDVLLLLGDLFLQDIDMLDDGSRARNGRGGRHIVQRCGVSQQRRAGRS